MPYLIKCPTCQKDVSTDAERCPHCGRNIDAYLKAQNANSTHDHEINKATFKIFLIIFGTIITTLIFTGFAFFCFIMLSFALEMHQICLDWSDYTGHYQTTANVFTALFVIFLLIGFSLVGFLIYKAVHVIKKQSKIIKNEKTFDFS